MPEIVFAKDIDSELLTESLEAARHLEELLESIDEANDFLPEIKLIIKKLSELEITQCYVFGEMEI
jgi:hypothetical protein